MASDGMTICIMIEQDLECKLFAIWHALYSNGKFEKAKCIEEEIMAMRRDKKNEARGR